VSKPEDSGAVAEQAAFSRLEGAIARMVEQRGRLTARAEAAEARVAELTEAVKRFTGDEAEAGRIMTRIRTLEEENADLRARLERARDGVDRMIARIRFLENQG
jgi:predicted RNase H-like nuclease (RuvC/YqgF family)